ncbi:MAG TPA: nitroreductase [Dongiaceae bacterium]|nr:nitroreductase [Dongiaceae bacterium]
MSISTDQTSAAFEQTITQRRSVRGFLSTPVPADTIRKVFTLAQRTPSNCNTQPWLTHVVSGAKLDTLRQRMYENAMLGKMTLDYPYSGKYDGVYKERQYDAAVQMYNAVGISREEKQKRLEVFLRNYKFFNAPHVAFLFLPEPFHIREAADVGMYAQSLMLGFTAFGLASCPQTSLGFHADLVREVLDVNPVNKLLFGISFGYEDTSDPINSARLGRAELDASTVFHD